MLRQFATPELCDCGQRQTVSHAAQGCQKINNKKEKEQEKPSRLLTAESARDLGVILEAQCLLMSLHSVNPDSFN